MIMKTARNPWPLAIIATFIVFISGILTVVVLASAQKTELVSNNYYEQELRYQSRIDSRDRTQNLGASATYDATSRRIVIALPAAHAGKLLTGQIQLYRPSAAGLDREFALRPAANGIQSLNASGLQNGLWKIRVAWNVAGQDYFLDETIVIGQLTPK